MKLQFLSFTTIFLPVWHGIILELTRQNLISQLLGHFWSLSSKSCKVLSFVYTFYNNERIKYIVNINSFDQCLIINLQQFLITKCLQALCKKRKFPIEQVSRNFEVPNITCNVFSSFGGQEFVYYHWKAIWRLTLLHVERIQSHTTVKDK